MNSSTSPTTTRQSKESDKRLEYLKPKVLPSSQLKSNIPKPVPYVRITREQRSKSCSSSCFKGRTPSVGILPTLKKGRSFSQSSPSPEYQQLTNKTSPSKISAQFGSSQSQLLSTTKGNRRQYCNVKAKIDNKSPVSLLLRSKGVHSKDCLMQSNNLVDARSKDSSLIDDSGQVSFLVDNRSKYSSLIDDRSKFSSVIDDRSKASSFVDDRSKDSSFVDDRCQDSSLVDDRSKDSSLADERIKECSLIHDRSKDNSLIDDRGKDCSLVDDTGKDIPLFDDREKDSSLVDDISRDFFEEPPGDKISRKNFSNDQLGNKKRPLTAYSGSDSHDSLNLHVPEGDISTLKKRDIFENMEGTKNCFLKECATEFLSSFEKRMEEVSKLWLQLICDLIVTKLTIGKSASPQLLLQSPKLSWRDIITKFFQNLPTQGELLHTKLCIIEEEQMHILRVVIHNIVALMKDQEELKRKNFQLEKTYEHNISRLKEELAILGQENKELDQKCVSAKEKYEFEKSKTEELEELQVEILKKIFQLRKVVKHVEGKCSELEKRGESVDTDRRKLEECIRTLETVHEKERKKFDDVLKKYAESENIISKLKREIERNQSSKTSLEEQVKQLQGEITDVKADFENSLQKRTELEKEVSEKNKKMEELEAEINLLKSNKPECQINKKPPLDENSLELVKDLVNDVEKRNLQIKELKKRLNRFEHMVREKSIREEKLLAHVTKLNKKCSNNSTFLNNTIVELQSLAKGLQGQVSDLEKVLGQKTLELDQRDRMIKELMELLRLKNESDPLPCQSTRHNCTENLKSAETEEVSFSRHKKMIEMFSLLEHKQMEIMKLEHRIWRLQKSRNYGERTGREQKQEKKEIDGAVD